MHQRTTFTRTLTLAISLFFFAVAVTSAIKAETPVDKVPKQWALLSEAKRLSESGAYDKANEKIASVLGEATDPKVIAGAREIQDANSPSLRDKLGVSPKILYTIAAWWLDIVLGILALLVLYGLLKLGRWIWTATGKSSWRLEPISDTANLALADIVIQSFSKWSLTTSPVTAGLLKLEWLQLPAVSFLNLPRTSLDLTAALKDLTLQIGGVNLGGIASAAGAIKGWFNSRRPWITGKAFISGSELVVSLTSFGPDGRTMHVVASEEGTQSPSIISTSPGPTTFTASAIRAVAETASYKMYYLISAPERKASDAEAANKLREGLNLLAKCIYGQDPDQLRVAYKAFRQGRTESDKFLEAYIYEGITLDLLQEHDEAIERFKYVQNHSEETSAINHNACYHEAISRLRKYNASETTEAGQILDKLIGRLPIDTPASQIKAMAQAAKASVIAQYIMYWTEIDGQGKSQLPDIRKGENKAKVEGWKTQIEKQTSELRNALAEIKSPDGTAQLEWALANALGSGELNYAIYFLGDPLLPEDETRTRTLEAAADKFRECELRLTPGLETLTNLGKVSLELKQFKRGYSYFLKAIELNSRYEYAYYRLASFWDLQGEEEKTVEMLKLFPKGQRIIIERFEALFQKYKTQLQAATAKTA